MNKEQLLALGLSEEQADKVIAGFGAMIPKSRFDEVNQAKKDLEKQIADRDKQLEELKKIDAEGLQAKITELQNANEAAKKDFEAKLKETQLNSALKLALAGKVHDADLVATLIDKEKIELGEDGNITKGLDEQIKSLQESKSFLFVPEKEPTKPKGTRIPDLGLPGGDDGNGNDGSFGKQLAEFSKSSNNLEQARNSYFE